MQESNYLKLVDQKYRLRQSKQYHLNVRLTGSSFSYTVYDPSQGKFMALFDARSAGKPIHIQPYMEEDDLLKQSFGLTRLMFTAQQFLLVPEELYDEKNVDRLFQAAFPAPGEVIITNPVGSLNARLLAALDGDTHSGMLANFSKAFLYHEGAALITGLQQQYDQAERSFLCLNIESHYLEIAFLLNGKLHFYNRFGFDNAEQFIYFPLLVCKQTGLDPAEINLLLSGVIDESSELYRQLRTYFRHIDFCELPNRFKYSKRLYDVPQHYFYSLINLELCG